MCGLTGTGIPSRTSTSGTTDIGRDRRTQVLAGSRHDTTAGCSSKATGSGIAAAANTTTDGIVTATAITMVTTIRATGGAGDAKIAIESANQVAAAA